MKNVEFIKFRQSLGFNTKGQAAKGFGVHYNTIKNLDNGLMPNIDTILKLKDTHRSMTGLDIDITEIFKSSF